MPLVAIEEHWMLPELTSALKAVSHPDESLLFNERGDLGRRLEDLGADRDRHHGRPGNRPGRTRPDSARDPGPAGRGGDCVSRLANDTAAEAVRSHPTRFSSLSTMPLSSPRGMSPPSWNVPHSKAMWAPWSTAAPATCSSMTPPTTTSSLLPPASVSRSSFTRRSRQKRCVPPPTEVSTPMTELGLATFGWGLARGGGDCGTASHPARHLRSPSRPADRAGPLGELLPFWLDRADSLARLAGLRRSVSDYIRTNVFLTTSGMLNPALLQHALTVTTVDRLIFSTDYPPFQQPTRAEIDTFFEHFATDTDRHKVRSANAAALFGVDPPLTP